MTLPPSARRARRLDAAPVAIAAAGAVIGMLLIGAVATATVVGLSAVFGLGLHNLGWRRGYEHRHTEARHERALWASPPCAPFSVAGRRRARD